MKQMSIEEYLKSAKVEWKPIPKDASVIIPGRRVHGLNMIKTIMEQRVMNEPDIQICGSVDGKPAEYFNNYIEKGDMISVTGSMQLNSYEKNGQQVTTIECYVTQINIVNKYNPMNKSQPQQQQAATQPQPKPQQAPPTPPPVYGQNWTPPVQHCAPAPSPDTWPDPIEPAPFDIYGGY